MSSDSEYSDDSTGSFPPLVIDNGSNTMKAGFSGSSSPRAFFPNITGVPRHSSAMVGCDEKDVFVGDEAQVKRGLLTLRYPMEHGIVTDWNHMEKIWHHMFFNELRIEPEEHRLLLTDAPLVPKANREKMVQLMFETFEARSLYVSLQSVLSMYASGRTTGVVLECGEGATHTLPVCEGNALPHAIQRLEMAGRDITHYLMKMLNTKGHAFSSTAHMEIVRDIKEELSCVSLDCPSGLDRRNSLPVKNTGKEYELPDRNTIIVGDERFQCMEPLFDPSLIGMQCAGVHSLLHNTIAQCRPDNDDSNNNDNNSNNNNTNINNNINDLYRNIILSGGTTLSPGFEKRLKKELSGLAPDTANVNVYAPNERKFSVWIGGSILSALSSFEPMWITKEEHDEHGPTLVHKKCF